VVAGFLVYAVVKYLVQVLGMTFYGGMFEMVVGAYRGGRNVLFGDLFSGYRRFGAYALYALVLFGISIGLSILNLIPLVGWFAGMAVSIWISIVWLYVLPLIADQGLGFGDAASRSTQLVKSAGWWWTFGMVFLLGLAALVAVAVIILIAVGVYQGSEWAGVAIGLLLFLVFAVLFPPYTICYVSVLYIASGGDVAVGAPAGGLPDIPPAPAAPAAFGTPASPTWTGSAPGATGVTTPVAPPSAGADAWRAAADPLAGQPPSTPAPAESPAPAADDAGTPVADIAAAEAPAPPEPPAPPAPPVPGPPGAGA
jgi:hypothetical protein